VGDSIFGSRFWLSDLVVRSFSLVGFGAAGSISHACRNKLNLHGFMYRISKPMETATGTTKQ